MRQHITSPPTLISTPGVRAVIIGEQRAQGAVRAAKAVRPNGREVEVSAACDYLAEELAMFFTDMSEPSRLQRHAQDDKAGFEANAVLVAN